MSQHIPDQFDWVGARSRCTPWTVMEILRDQVRADMQMRNALTKEQGFPKKVFQLQEHDNWFAVIAPGIYGDPPKGVIFRMTAVGVNVLDVSKNLLHLSVLALSDEGKCRLRIDETEYTFWQFRKLALHDLFFVDSEDSL